MRTHLCGLRSHRVRTHMASNVLIARDTLLMRVPNNPYEFECAFQGHTHIDARSKAKLYGCALQSHMGACFSPL